MGRLAKGGAVVNGPGTRVDGYSPPQTKKLGLQSKLRRGSNEQAVGLDEALNSV
jgi:hypothetical protein